MTTPHDKLIPLVAIAKRHRVAPKLARARLRDAKVKKPGGRWTFRASQQNKIGAIIAGH